MPQRVTLVGVRERLGPRTRLRGHGVRLKQGERHILLGRAMLITGGRDAEGTDAPQVQAGRRRRPELVCATVRAVHTQLHRGRTRCVRTSRGTDEKTCELVRDCFYRAERDYTRTPIGNGTQKAHHIASW